MLPFEHTSSHLLLTMQQPNSQGPQGSGASSSPFKAPPNPALPQDLSLIMEMVASHQVVGSLPPLDVSVAEKRRLVEESMRARARDKGKEKDLSENTPGVAQSSSSTTETSQDRIDEEASSSGESSSEYESSSEE